MMNRLSSQRSWDLLRPHMMNWLSSAALGFTHASIDELALPSPVLGFTQASYDELSPLFAVLGFTQASHDELSPLCCPGIYSGLT